MGNKIEVNEDLIKHIAKLARLDLTKQEISTFTPQLKEILESFSKLDEVDTKNITPMFQPIEIRNKLREDKQENPLTNEQALSNTDLKKDGYFQGPKAV